MNFHNNDSKSGVNIVATIGYDMTPNLTEINGLIVYISRNLYCYQLYSVHLKNASLKGHRTRGF